MLSIQKSYLLEETTKLSALEIGTEGKIETPEGMLLTMTVDGVQKDVLPGSYRGDIVLTVTRRIPAPIEGMHPKPGDPPTDYRAVLLLGEGVPVYVEKGLTWAVNHSGGECCWPWVDRRKQSGGKPDRRRNHHYRRGYERPDRNPGNPSSGRPDHPEQRPQPG